MLNRFTLLLLMLVSIRAFSQTEDDNRILNQFIVMLKPGQSVDELVKEFPALKVNKCLSQQMNIWLMERGTNSDAEKFLLTLKNGKAVKLAQFNHHVQQRSLIPDDPYFNNQWNMLNTGQGGGTVGADIDATDAWAINHNNTTASGDSVVIAIIDGGPGIGFDYTHQDLSFFVNTHEIPNNGIDDDSDGYVDDYNGWNAINSNWDINMGQTDDHAMHVSGIAGAIGNNGTGIAGVCWGGRILRVVGASGDESQVVEAYAYVREMRRLYNSTNGAKGAFVVSSNSSFGVNEGQPADYPIWCAMYDSMGYVGILSAAATADEPYNIDVTGDIPTGCPSKYLITVTSVNDLGQLAPYRAYGDTTIALGAPGEGIYSTISNNGYEYMSGTSMASPHIAGAVGAMFAAACPKLLNDYKLYPDSVALQVKEMLESGVTRASSLYNETITGGALNLYNAIKNLEEYNCGACNYSVGISVTQPKCSNTCNGSVQVNVSGPGVYSYVWSNNQTGVSVLNNLCPGVYAVTVTDTASGCQQVQNAYLYKPDSIDISSIHIIPVVGGDSGNIIVTANAGNYQLEYSLNGTNYQNASTLVVSNNGNYNVFVKNNIGCVVEQSVSVSGEENISAESSWSLFPNPVNGQLNITFNLPATTQISIGITNILGQKILSDARSVQGGISNITSDVSSLSAGTYFITISNGKSSSTRRFVVAR